MKEDDVWLVNAELITRVHQRPRRTLYTPTEEECPIPLQYIDVVRFAKTSSPEKQFKEIDDYWMRDGSPDLGFERVGATRVTVLKPTPPEKGWYWVEG